MIVIKDLGLIELKENSEYLMSKARYLKHKFKAFIVLSLSTKYPLHNVPHQSVAPFDRKKKVDAQSKGSK